MIPKPVNTTSDNPRLDLFESYLKRMDERAFAWAQVHYERAAVKWANEESRIMWDLVRAETARRDNEQRGQAA